MVNKWSIIVFILVPVLAIAQAQDKKDGEEKIYTQKEFDEAINQRLKKISNKGLVELSNELIKKEEEIKLAEMELKKREDALKLTEEDLSKKFKEFEKSRTEFIGCLTKNEQEEKKRITHMVSTVSGMKPKNAAEVLSVQDADIAVKILGRLKSEKVAKIFNLMDKEVSARLQKQYLNMKK